MNDSFLHFDVIIVGAGPAGSTCALALQNSGLKVAIIDKAVFPRDKICGDAIPTRAVKVLKKINPEYSEALSQFERKVKITSTRFVTSSGKDFKFHWKNETYNCMRKEFDNLLFNWVKIKTKTQIFENTTVESVSIKTDCVQLKTNTQAFTGAIVIGCDGAHSLIAKKLAGSTVNKKMYSAAVRIYLKEITETQPGLNEVFFSKKYMPGYFWLFPVNNEFCNIGFGMLSESIAKNKINLKKSLPEVINEFPELKRRFTNVNFSTTPEGYGLPMSNCSTTLSGNRFLLCGDAGSLIDPVSGDGIGNALVSAWHAANHVISCFSKNCFNAATNKNYDRAVYDELGKELRRNATILRISSKFPRLMDWLIGFLSKDNLLARYLRKKM